jgi:hypothetical protein
MVESGAGRVVVFVEDGGLLKGDIFESGTGPVYVTTDSGDFEGSVVEQDDGSVEILVGLGSSFKGDVEESGRGSLVAEIDGLFEGNLIEFDGGNLTTAGDGRVKGNSEHQLPGICNDSTAEFEGSPCVLIN